MPELDLRQFEQSFVIHFGGEFRRINAYTLASTLANLADAARAANSVINPGYDIEIVVEALEAGSFKAQVRALYKGAGNLFSRDTLKGIAIGVVANFIFQHTLANTPDVIVNVTHEDVIIQHGDTRVIVPRDVYEATREVEANPQFRRGIGGVARAIADDPSVRSLGFSRDLHQPEPPLEIPRERIVPLPEQLEEEGGETRELFETADLQIMRAILERSRRRWEFVWNGVRISAPLTDPAFYDDFFAHRITLAPGDALRVRLKIRQRRNPDLGFYVNESYEVVEVLGHSSRSRQVDMLTGRDEPDDEE